MQALKLPTLLEGEAVAIWLELSEDEKKITKEQRRALLTRLCPWLLIV